MVAPHQAERRLQSPLEAPDSEKEEGLGYVEQKPKVY